MPRAIWSGSISLGLVNVPVKLHAAERRKDVSFHQLEEKSGARIRNKRVSEKTGREVPFERIVKGYEVDKGRHIPLTDEELASVEPEGGHVLTVEDFVALDDIDPMLFQRAYWVVPDSNDGARKAYALLRDGLKRTKRVGIGRFVLRTKEHLVCLRVADGAIVLQTMLFPDEIVPASDVAGLDFKVKPTPRELKMAEQLIDSLTVAWKPDRYHDTYREALQKLIKRKAKGDDVVVEPAAERDAEVLDLMAALEASLAQGKRKKKRAS